MPKMIEKYYGYCFDGKGEIVDREEGRKIIVFDFSMYEDEVAKEICRQCLRMLNEL